MKKYEGIYNLEEGGQYRVWLDNNHLKIGADGQMAINNLLSVSELEAKVYQKTNERRRSK